MATVLFLLGFYNIMARPIKRGLDYFPMDIITDDKFEIIESKHGLVAFAIIIKLYQAIYKEGCYIEWNEDKLFLFKKRINVDINLINEVINDCFFHNILDMDIYNKYKILTSSGIQKRYLMACERRKSIDLIKKYIIVDINSINVNINWVNNHNNTQSKVNKTKGNKSKSNMKNFWASYEETEQILLSESEKAWRDIALMHSGIKTERELITLIKKFLLKNAASDFFPHEISATKRYFINWLNVNAPEKQQYKPLEGAIV